MKGWDILVAGVGTELNALGWSNVSDCFGRMYAARDAKDELIDRLNTRLRGEDPGQPINWKGLP